MEKTTISVVMTTYNGENYIKEQLWSILEQSIKPDEIIIADDCSKDCTYKIVSEIKQQTDISIDAYVNENNLGYILNFKRAMSKAKGDYIFLCDQDDVWEKNKIEKTLSCMKEFRAKVACTGFRLIDGNGSYIRNLKQYDSDPISGYDGWTDLVKKITVSRLIWGNFSPGCTYCFTTEILKIFDSIDNSEISHDFQILLIGANNGTAIYIDSPLSRYRLHDTNTIGMNNKEPKRKRHFEPRLSRFLGKLSCVQSVKVKYKYNLVLYLRLPKIRSIIIHRFHLKNHLNL